MMGAGGPARAPRRSRSSTRTTSRARLAPHYPVLYTGANGLVAHECIIDLRPITRDTGVTVDDVAKRLIDYGFHAPTMSFPVAGTLMIEPTESEDLAELDRFVDAMIAIRAEIDRVARASGRPTTIRSRTRRTPRRTSPRDDWTRAYPRELAAFPVRALRHAKYWPPGRPHRQRLRRPQRLLLLPAGRGVRSD